MRETTRSRAEAGHSAALPRHRSAANRDVFAAAARWVSASTFHPQALVPGRGPVVRAFPVIISPEGKPDRAAFAVLRSASAVTPTPGASVPELTKGRFTHDDLRPSDEVVLTNRKPVRTHDLNVEMKGGAFGSGLSTERPTATTPRSMSRPVNGCASAVPRRGCRTVRAGREVLDTPRRPGQRGSTSVTVRSMGSGLCC